MTANALTVLPQAHWRTRLASTPDALATTNNEPSPHPLVPFGARVEMALPGVSIFTLPVSWLHAWLRAHRLLVLRGFEPLVPGELAAFGRALGSVDPGADGALDDTDLSATGRKHHGADGELRMHWNVVAGRAPRYLLFCCEKAPRPGGGGEALFCDTTRLLASASVSERTAWGATRIRGGRDSGRSIVRPHRLTGEAVLRYMEPPDDELRFRDGGEQPGRLARRLYDTRICYTHTWRDGDMLVADNDALLHGRAALGRSDGCKVRRLSVFWAPARRVESLRRDAGAPLRARIRGACCKGSTGSR